MKSFLFSVILSLPLLLSAQQQIGHLTIFSEDGDKFFVMLNGEKQNTVAQSNLRIEDLPQPYYSAKIMFEDASIAPIEKKNLQLTDLNGVMMDVTYRIKKDKAGKVKLQPYSSIEVKPDFVAPSGTTVYHYGNPSNEGAVSTTTTTTRNTSNANINVGGMNMSISIDDPDAVTSTTTTRTTTTRTSSSTINGQPVNTNTQGQGNNNGGCIYPMNSSSFSSARSTIANANFDESKLSTAKSIIAGNCLTSDQVVEICKIFSFEQTKLDFAKAAYIKTTDKSNYFKVSNVFDFDASKEELSAFISNR